MGKGHRKHPPGRCYICLHSFAGPSEATWSEEHQEVIHPKCEGRKLKPLNKKRSTRPRARR